MALILSGTNGLSDVDGSAATPAIRGTDANTGIFFPAADTIAFSEGGVEAMRIDSSGRVGIGTSSPAHKLEAKSASATTSVRINAADSENRSVFIESPNLNQVAKIGTSGTGNSLAIELNSTERLRIDSSGNLLVGTTTSLGSCLTTKNSSGSTPVHAVQHYSSAAAVWYMLRFFNGADSGGGAITLNTSTLATAYTTSSDYRLKHDIAPMTGALERVAALKPVTYKWNADDSNGEGFIAHELQAVVPDCVTGEKDAVDAEGNPQYQGVDTSFLVATLTAAIQELKALVDGQAVLIATQASTITALQADVEALKAQP